MNLLWYSRSPVDAENDMNGSIVAPGIENTVAVGSSPVEAEMCRCRFNDDDPLAIHRLNMRAGVSRHARAVVSYRDRAIQR
ncbi:MAG: hypothetical protein O3C10_13880 [Chloroflexi bacterium]|nr:hypothetical protein [Chloroflexota bacterium]